MWPLFTESTISSLHSSQTHILRRERSWKGYVCLWRTIHLTIYLQHKSKTFAFYSFVDVIRYCYCRLKNTLFLVGLVSFLPLLFVYIFLFFMKQQRIKEGFKGKGLKKEERSGTTVKQTKSFTSTILLLLQILYVQYTKITESEIFF